MFIVFIVRVPTTQPQRRSARIFVVLADNRSRQTVRKLFNGSGESWYLRSERSDRGCET